MSFSSQQKQHGGGSHALTESLAGVECCSTCLMRTSSFTVPEPQPVVVPAPLRRGKQTQRCCLPRSPG